MSNCQYKLNLKNAKLSKHENQKNNKSNFDTKKLRYNRDYSTTIHTHIKSYISSICR